MMRSLSYLFVLTALTYSTNSNAAMWAAGDLTYANGETEVSAFVNAPGDTQLQAVLCSKNSQNNYRFTLLLPKKLDSDSVIKVNVKTDELNVEEYGEVSGNSLDLQMDENLLLAIPDSTKLSLVFDKEDAEYLGIPATIDVSMSGADMTLRNVASECTALCIGNDFKCNFPLLSSLLWPQDRYEKSYIDNVDELCTAQLRPNLYKFNYTDSCKLALDRFYKKDGIGPLSYIYKLFNDKNSVFNKYNESWNKVISLSSASALNLPIKADGREWYLALYSLVGKKHIKEFPVSFYTIKSLHGDPTTVVYDTDNRYEMELLKYSSVLYRRVKGSVSAVNAVEQSLKLWSDFYRQLSGALPNIQQAQAIRPIIYRTMLMRIWNLAGKPQGIRLLPENAFKQGTGGKTVTGETLESQCSFFEGANGEQFYFASDSCINGIEDYMRISPLNTDKYSKVVSKWNAFSNAWSHSQFYNDSIDDAVGEHPRANLGLVILSMFKLYGFGDYFLLRECISSRDMDICGYEAHKAYYTYSKEFKYRLESITNVSDEDGKKLNDLNELWLDYYHTLDDYLDDLVDKGYLPQWRASFVKGLAYIIQTNALLNFPYDRAELPDVSLKNDTNMDGDVIDEKGNKMTIEQDKYQDYQDDDDYDPDADIDDDIIVPY